MRSEKRKRYECSFAITRISKIKKRKFEGEVEEYCYEARGKLRFNLNCRNEEEVDVLFHVSLSTVAVILAGWRYVGPRQPNRNKQGRRQSLVGQCVQKLG